MHFDNPNTDDELTSWAVNYIKNMTIGKQQMIDASVTIAIIKDMESHWEVKDFMVSNFGDSKETKKFAEMFTDKRTQIKNQEKQRKQKMKEMELAKQQLEKRKRAQELAQKQKVQSLTAQQQNRKISDDSNNSNW